MSKTEGSFYPQFYPNFCLNHPKNMCVCSHPTLTPTLHSAHTHTCTNTRTCERTCMHTHTRIHTLFLSLSLLFNCQLGFKLIARFHPHRSLGLFPLQPVNPRGSSAPPLGLRSTYFRSRPSGFEICLHHLLL